MILKNFEINKINLRKNKFLLFYGKNEGFKNDVIEMLTREEEGVTNYEEKKSLKMQKLFLKTYFQNLFLKIKK